MNHRLGSAKLTRKSMIMSSYAKILKHTILFKIRYSLLIAIPPRYRLNPMHLFLDNGGWTVLQNRGDFGNPEDFFYRGWNDYEGGFGEPTKVIIVGNHEKSMFLGGFF